MATASVTNTFVTATTMSSSAMNTNFTDLTSFLNSSVLHLDGSKTMTGNLKLGTQTLDFNNVTYGFSSYTPVLVASSGGWEINNGTNVGRYARLGKLVILTATITWGSTTASGTGTSYTALSPVAFTGNNAAVFGTWSATDSNDGNRVYTGPVRKISSTALRFDRDGVSGGGVAPATPFTFAVGDSISWTLMYESD